MPEIQGILNGIIGAVKVIQTNCSKMIPKHDQIVFLFLDRINPMKIYLRTKKPVVKSKNAKNDTET